MEYASANKKAGFTNIYQLQYHLLLQIRFYSNIVASYTIQFQSCHFLLPEILNCRRSDGHAQREVPGELGRVLHQKTPCWTLESEESVGSVPDLVKRKTGSLLMV